MKSESQKNIGMFIVLKALSFILSMWSAEETKPMQRILMFDLLFQIETLTLLNYTNFHPVIF